MTVEGWNLIGLMYTTTVRHGKVKGCLVRSLILTPGAEVGGTAVSTTTTHLYCTLLVLLVQLTITFSHFLVVDLIHSLLTFLCSLLLFLATRADPAPLHLLYTDSCPGRLVLTKSPRVARVKDTRLGGALN